MELRQIRYLIKVVEHGSYARAAEALGITQSALTQSIAKLESEVGVKLLHRGRFGVSPTDAGEMLLGRAALIDAEARMASQELEAYRGGTRGDVRIGVGKSLVNWLIPDALARFAAQRPDVVVTAWEGISGELFQRLVKGELDFVVSAPTPNLTLDRDLTQQVLFEQHEIVVLGSDHPLAAIEAPTLRDLHDCHWVVTPLGMGRVSHLREVFAAAGLVPPRRFIRTDSAVLMERLVEMGAGLGLGTTEMLMPGGKSLVELRIPELMTTRRACITKRRRSRLPPLAAHLEALIISGSHRLHA